MLTVPEPGIVCKADFITHALIFVQSHVLYIQFLLIMIQVKRSEVSLAVVTIYFRTLMDLQAVQQVY